MEGEIDANVPLDYIEFQIFPGQSRYEVSICVDNCIESVSSGTLEPLLLHSPKIRAVHEKGCDAKYKLVASDDCNAASRWFTKSTLVRFLDIIGSSEALNATIAARNEISQLEEARGFHLSLYMKVPQNHIDSEDEEFLMRKIRDMHSASTLDRLEGKTFLQATDNSTGDTSTLKVGIISAASDDSKNELLRAMDLRLMALREELAAAFGQAAIARCSTQEVNDLQKFSFHFGATDLRSSLSKLIEPSREKSTANFPHNKQSSIKTASGNGRISNKEDNIHNPIQSHSEIPVKYGVSPAKVAEIERQLSSESGESSCTSEEEQPSVERSRTLIRSASPRRSASPMRRIQIGRTGSRRATPLTIKSLNYFPKERLLSHKDAAEHSSDEEASEQRSKRPETNVRRMSVQDAINLFESKQRDQNVDIQKTRSLFNATMGPNKSVLRRWSAGPVESSNECLQDDISDNSVAFNPDNLVKAEITNGSPELQPEHGITAESHPADASEGDIKPDLSEQSAHSLVSVQESARAETVGTNEKLTASAEWSRQKEAELNQLLMKMMETKPVKYRKGTPENSKSQNLSAEQRGGSYDHYKEKRNEKLRRETAGKKTEKEKNFQAMQQILDERKAEMVSSNASDGKKRNVKTQKSQKTSSQPGNTKKDVAKPSVVRKASSKASPLPATRQSWPSIPSTRSTGISPVKTPPGTTSARTTPTRRKSQPPPSAPKSSPKVERTEPQPKSLKATQKDMVKAVRSVNEKKQQPLRKTAKPTNPKVQTNSGEPKPGKPSLYNKVTKKSSIVPLESKTFLRKGSGIGSGVNPASRTKVSSQPGESLKESGDLTQAEENVRVSSSSDPVIQQPEVVLGQIKDLADGESEDQEKRQEENVDLEIPNQAALEDASFQNTPDCKLDSEAAEESTIPPTAWVEIEEHEDQAVPSTDGISQIESSPNVTPVGMPSPRVRHSLSQMLLEESSEPDVIEWGNAENPPAMVYQKDAPKGLKRLLKFARKSKTDANSTGWSSPSVFSEGEDDTEESKSISKRSTDNLLKKATLHAKNHGHQKTSHEKDLAANGVFAQAKKSKATAQSLSEKLQDGQISASVTSTKATRSFFSLSAFKGGKQNEIKFR